MPAITYKEWTGGLDRRLPIGVQDANRLWTLTNAYITAGKKIMKRPGLRLLSPDLAGSVGLEALNGGVCVFASVGDAFVAPNGVGLLNLTPHSPGDFPTELVDVVSAQMFQGYPYLVAKHRTRVPRPPPPPGQVSAGGTIIAVVTRHHYVDEGPDTRVTDANCPHGDSATVAASRIFSTGGETVPYSAAGDARDWTTADDAGFLPVTLQSDQRAECAAVGTFRESLVVFFPESAQVWGVQVDPSANQLTSRIDGVGTGHPISLSSFYQDLAFLSQFGIRSITVQQQSDRIDETDIGVPVDPLVSAAVAANSGPESAAVLGIWIQQFGQYWVLFDAGGYTQAFVYSFSRSSKLAAWSVYTFPVLLTGITTASGKAYVRTASSLYELAADQFTDDSEPIDVDVQMAFQDAKLPGVEKMFYGADFVFEGAPQLSYLYDPRDPSKETNPQTVTGDTRAGTLVPVEVSAAAIAPRFQHSADEAFSIDMVTLYYHPLSAQSS